MKSKKTVPTRFGPETRFEFRPTPAAPFHHRVEDELETLKRRLLDQKLSEIWDPDSNSEVRRAANEAAAAAWVTPYPLLVFPELFQEKASFALKRAERQNLIRRVTRELLAV
jgi:hypothetical protein